LSDSLDDQALRVAHDAARVLYDNHRALGLDVLAVKLDTLRVDLAVELENRGNRSPRPTVSQPPPPEAYQAHARDQPARLELQRSTIAMTSASPRAGSTEAPRPEHAAAQDGTLRVPGAHVPPFPVPCGGPVPRAGRNPNRRRCEGSLRP
jgi:hypothetical protein